MKSLPGQSMNFAFLDLGVESGIDARELVPKCRLAGLVRGKVDELL